MMWEVKGRFEIWFPDLSQRQRERKQLFPYQLLNACQARKRAQVAQTLPDS